MSQRKISIFTAIIILLLIVTPLVQAAPPRQEGSTAGASLGDSFNLDDEGNVVGEVISGGMNLGSIMSGKKTSDDGGTDDDDAGDTDDDDTNGDDDADDDDTGDDDGDTDDDDADDDTGDTDDDDTNGDDDTDDDDTNGDDDADDDGDTDDDDADDDDTGGDDDGADTLIKQHPVAAAIADHFEVSYEEVKALHDSGYGFGNIAKAYFFAEALELTPDELLDEAQGSGWGNVLKQNGIHPGAVGHGQLDKAGGPPAHAGGPNKAGQPDSLSNGEAGSSLTGPGGGNGNGNGNGKGKGKEKNDNGNKGKGKGKGKNK